MTSAVVHNNRIQTTSGFMVMESRNAELDENVEQDDLSQFMKKMSKTQRKVADRLKDPIVDKTDKRKSNI